MQVNTFILGYSESLTSLNKFIVNLSESVYFCSAQGKQQQTACQNICLAQSHARLSFLVRNRKNRDVVSCVCSFRHLSHRLCAIPSVDFAAPVSGSPFAFRLRTHSWHKCCAADSGEWKHTIEKHTRTNTQRTSTTGVLLTSPASAWFG